MKEYALDENTGSYKTTTDLFGKRISLSVIAPSEHTTYGTIEDFVLQSKQRLDWLKINQHTIEKKLEELYLGWIDKADDLAENLITKEEFIRRFTVTGIVFYEDLSLEVCYDGGDTFGGHGIAVHVTSDYNIGGIQIFG